MTASPRTRLTAAVFAVAMSTLVLGGTALAMTAEADQQPQQILVMERTVITSNALN